MEDFLWCVRFDFVVDEKRKKWMKTCLHEPKMLTIHYINNGSPLAFPCFFSCKDLVAFL